MQLVKVEGGLCTGEVLYHSYSKFYARHTDLYLYIVIVEKSAKEKKMLKKKILEQKYFSRHNIN